MRERERQRKYMPFQSLQQSWHSEIYIYVCMCMCVCLCVYIYVVCICSYRLGDSVPMHLGEWTCCCFTTEEMQTCEHFQGEGTSFHLATSLSYRQRGRSVRITAWISVCSLPDFFPSEEGNDLSGQWSWRQNWAYLAQVLPLSFPLGLTAFREHAFSGPLWTRIYQGGFPPRGLWGYSCAHDWWDTTTGN